VRRSIAFSILALTLTLCGCGGGGNTAVVMDTSMGSVKIELFDEESPITVKNFLRYVDDRYYDGTIFHRVIPNFMIQGGGLDINLQEKPARGQPIKNEAYNGKKNKRGTVAMARTPDPDSATDQFFINVVDNPGLDRQMAKGEAGYAVFGQVTDGMDVADKISKVKTQADMPLVPILIKTIRRVSP
jgi:peptidyl-prolyl cis-trans isomerase A (cyclophilin A)